MRQQDDLVHAGGAYQCIDLGLDGRRQRIDVIGIGRAHDQVTGGGDGRQRRCRGADHANGLAAHPQGDAGAQRAGPRRLRRGHQQRRRVAIGGKVDVGGEVGELRARPGAVGGQQFGEGARAQIQLVVAHHRGLHAQCVQPAHMRAAGIGGAQRAIQAVVAGAEVLGPGYPVVARGQQQRVVRHLAAKAVDQGRENAHVIGAAGAIDIGEMQQLQREGHRLVEAGAGRALRPLRALRTLRPLGTVFAVHAIADKLGAADFVGRQAAILVAIHPRIDAHAAAGALRTGGDGRRFHQTAGDETQLVATGAQQQRHSGRAGGAPQTKISHDGLPCVLGMRFGAPRPRAFANLGGVWRQRRDLRLKLA